MQHQNFQTFLDTHQLPPSYLDSALTHFASIIDDILSRLKAQRPIVLGINGCQGSGKSTAAAFLQQAFESEYSLKVVNISLDDFYLSQAARQHNAQNIHPLFATRGVPGTHDTELAISTLEALKAGDDPLISRFNKATDDLFPQEEWDKAPKQVDLIILEGWCLGARADTEASLVQPINALERNEDSQGIWRRQVNKHLKQRYASLFDYIDCLVMLKAPSFDSVFHWRLEQEIKLAKKLLSSGTRQASTSGLMNEAEIQHFVQFFQRLTENMLTEMPARADHCYFLNGKRQIVHEQHNTTPSIMADPDIH